MKFFASFVMFLLLLNGFSTAQTLIQDSCKKAATKDPNLKYDFCVNSLQQDPQSKAATNLKDLVLASTKTAAGETSKVIGIINHIVRDAKYGEDILSTLSYCGYLFDRGVLHDIDGILEDIKSSHYRSASTGLRAALSFPPGCDHEFNKIKQHNPITNENNVLYQKILIPVALIKLLS